MCLLTDLPCLCPPALPCSVRGGDEAGDALHAPSLRLRLLHSLASVIAAAKVRCHCCGSCIALGLPGLQSRF